MHEQARHMLLFHREFNTHNQRLPVVWVLRRKRIGYKGWDLLHEIIRLARVQYPCETSHL